MLHDVFYEPNGLQSFLARMPTHAGHARGTHDTPAVRARELAAVLQPLSFAPPAKLLEPRKIRFAKRMGR